MRVSRRRLRVAVLICFLLAACTPTAAQPTPTLSPFATASPSPSPQPTVTFTPSPTVAPTVTVAPTPSPSPTATPFYTQLLYAAGFPVRGSAKVRPEAMTAAAATFTRLVSGNAAIINRMRSAGLSVSVIAESEKLTDLPEYARLRGGTLPDGRSYDTLRGIGPSPCAAGEENVLHLPSDAYEGADLLVHECAHAVLIYGLDARQTAAWAEIYADSIAAGRWRNTYAATSASEFFAELTESYFGVNAPPQPGVHNDVNGPERLAAYDPAAFAFLKGVYTPGASP